VGEKGLSFQCIYYKRRKKKKKTEDFTKEKRILEKKRSTYPNKEERALISA